MRLVQRTALRRTDADLSDYVDHAAIAAVPAPRDAVVSRGVAMNKIYRFITKYIAPVKGYGWSLLLAWWELAYTSRPMVLRCAFWLERHGSGRHQRIHGKGNKLLARMRQRLG